jgi:hypothetical protein
MHDVMSCSTVDSTRHLWQQSKYVDWLPLSKAALNTNKKTPPQSCSRLTADRKLFQRPFLLSFRISNHLHKTRPSTNRVSSFPLRSPNQQFHHSRGKREQPSSRTPYSPQPHCYRTQPSGIGYPDPFQRRTIKKHGFLVLEPNPPNLAGLLVHA